MAKMRNIILIAILLMTVITACSKSPEEKARNALRQVNIEYSENSFIKYVEKGDKAVVGLFITAGMSPDAKNKEGISALNIAVRSGHIEMVTLLLAKGADVNAKDNEGWTALMEAARVNNVEVVKILIDKGVDVNTKNNNERTALMIAKNKTWPDIVNILEKAGATIPKELIERLLTVADSQWQKEDYQNAIESYKEILSLDPNNSKAKEFLKKYSGVRFIFSDLTIKDISTRLMWTRDANIAGRPMTWFMTSTFIEKLNKQKYAGYNDWRVPTIEELETLADYVKVQGCERGCNKLFSKIGFRKVQDRYWSSSPYEDPEDRIGYWAKGIILEDGGYVFSDSMILRTYVWPVRAGQ